MVSNSTRIVLHRLGSEAAADTTVNTQSAAVAGGETLGEEHIPQDRNSRD